MSYPGYKKGNRIKVLKGRVMVYVPTGEVILVSPEDEAIARSRTWSFSKNAQRPGNRYVRSYSQDKVTKKITQYSLHREIMAPPSGFFVDHISGNTLDNRRCNLRLATATQSNRNRSYKNNGVSFRADCKFNPWQARIRVDTRLINIGHFPTKEEAQAARAAAVKLHFGEFAPTRRL